MYEDDEGNVLLHYLLDGALFFYNFLLLAYVWILFLFLWNMSIMFLNP